MKTNRIEVMAMRFGFLAPMLIVVAFVFTLGCDTKPQIDKDPAEVEKRRQDFIQQSDREAGEALPTE